jgi:uncharacterized protein (TIGR02246 family)
MEKNTTFVIEASGLYYFVTATNQEIDHATSNTAAVLEKSQDTFFKKNVFTAGLKSVAVCAVLLLSLANHSECNARNVKANATPAIVVEKTDKQLIEQVISEYQKALATSNATLATSLFTKKATFMPSGGPSAVGSEQIKGSFDYVFSLIKPTIKFTVNEVLIKGDYAFVTSTSTGTSLVHANGQTVPEVNRELFVFEKENGKWKIAKYMFNKMS